VGGWIEVVVEVEENPSKKTEEILQLNRLKTRVAEGDRIPLVDYVMKKMKFPLNLARRRLHLGTSS
jgi:hypothetical protein